GKAVHGELAAGVPTTNVVRQIVLFGARSRDGWGVGLTILTALANLLPLLSQEETYLALFHGARRVADDCEGQAPRQERAPLASRPDLPTLKRWLRRWTAVRHREAAERTVLTAIARGSTPGELAGLLLAAETDRAFADSGHSLDFINKAFECLGRSLASAAALRVAYFGSANEHSDWETAHHVFTHANAVHQMVKRIGIADPAGHAEAVRSILYGAMALYLARYLNVPPERIPGEGGELLDDLPRD